MVDLSECDREPIHIPGKIQPHGVLFALAEPLLTVTHVSENVGEQFSVGIEEILGQPISTLIDAASADELRKVLAEERWIEANPLPCDVQGRRFEGIVHRHDGVAILELEPALDQPRPTSLHHLFRTLLLRMQRVNTLAELGDVVVESVRAVTGFERVMFYRFHEDGHGSVDAESKEPALEPYLGLHYPASDIPAQVRQLYLANGLRLIVDARATPARIVGSPGSRRDAPLDLSFAVLRSVSPIHLEYMANMGVRASMSFSLVVGGRLWGLISCLDHTGPRRVPHETRAACEFIGRLTSLQIAALTDRELLTTRAARRATEDTLAAAMRETPPEGSVLGSLLVHPNELMALVGAGGAAVVGPGELSTCGRTPSPTLIRDLAAWIEHQRGIRLFSTDSLAARFPGALAACDVASGLLTFALPGVPQRRLLWFRPELVETVSWGGDPNKAGSTDAGGRLRPRDSFARWREEVRCRASPWTVSDCEAAEELQRHALEFDLERRLASEQRAVRARDELLAVVSHDLRSPLATILMQVGLMKSETSAPGDGAALRACAERIARPAAQMKTLIDDLMDLAKIEAQRFVVRPRDVDSRSMVEEAVLTVAPLAESKQIRLSEEWIDTPRLHADRGQILRVLSNLLGNAIKFSPEGGEVTVRTERSDGNVMISVADTGPGIPADQLPWVFERYWQERPVSHAGAGLGLYIARGIVEAHGGRIWAESSPRGARLTFVLPLAH